MFLVHLITNRKFFTVLASVIFFGNSLVLRQWVGTAFVFTGGNIMLDIDPTPLMQLLHFRNLLGWIVWETKEARRSKNLQGLKLNCNSPTSFDPSIVMFLIQV